MRPNQLPNEEEFLGWLEHPVTQAVFHVLKLKIEEVKEQWANGEFLDASQFATAIGGARAIGRCDAFRLMLELDHAAIIGELTDE